MKIVDKIIDKVIDDVLKKKKQPYTEEFKAFIRHVMMDNYKDYEIEDRINAIKIRSGGTKK